MAAPRHCINIFCPDSFLNPHSYSQLTTWYPHQLGILNKRDKTELLFSVSDISTIHNILYHHLPSCLSQNSWSYAWFFFPFPSLTYNLLAKLRRVLQNKIWILILLIPCLFSAWFEPPSSFPGLLNSLPAIFPSLCHHSVVHAPCSCLAIFLNINQICTLHAWFSPLVSFALGLM